MKKFLMEDLVENYFFLDNCREGECDIDGYGLFRGDLTLDENGEIPADATPIATFTTVAEDGSATLELDGGDSGEHHGDLLLAWSETDALTETTSWTILGKVHIGNLLPHEHMSIAFSPLTDCIDCHRGYSEAQAMAVKAWAEGKFAPIEDAGE